MSESGSPPSQPSAPDSAGQGERLVYVMPEGGLSGAADDEIDLLELWNILWQGKWLVIASTVVFAVGSVFYALSQTQWYRAEVLLAPAEGRTTPAGGQLGGLAALAGVSVGGSESAEAIATLRSRDFIRAFIEDFDLMPVLFAEQWDASRGNWLDADPDNWPDIRDGVRFFRDTVLSVSESHETALVTVAVEWQDPTMAASWAMMLIERLNERLRDRALQEAETNVSYLQGELAQTSVVTLQQTIGRLLESELQKVMLARGNEEFAFRVIDAAEVPKQPSRPRRSLIAIIGTMLGGMLGVFAVFVRHMVTKAKAPATA